MKGALLSVWELTWEEIWLQVQSVDAPDVQIWPNILVDYDLPDDYEPHDDLFASLYRELFPALTPSAQAKIDVLQVINDAKLAADSFHTVQRTDLASELSLVRFLEDAMAVLGEFDELLAQRYFLLLQAFISRYNLRYNLRSPCRLVPTIPGIFASLFQKLSALSEGNEHLRPLILDFDTSVTDFNIDRSENRIRSCIQKLVVLIEAISQTHPEVGTARTLGESCNSLGTWPHPTIAKSLSVLYGFTSDYPGIRHAGHLKGKVRDLNMRDFVALSVILAAFTPYLTEDIDFEDLYLPATPGEDLQVLP